MKNNSANDTQKEGVKVVESLDRNDDGRYESYDWRGMESNEPANIEVSKMVWIGRLLHEISLIEMHELFPYTELLKSMDPK